MRPTGLGRSVAATLPVADSPPWSMLPRLDAAALVHESDNGAKVSSAVLSGYFTANDFGLPSSNIRFRMLQAMTASASCDSG